MPTTHMSTSLRKCYLSNRTTYSRRRSRCCDNSKKRDHSKVGPLGRLSLIAVMVFLPTARAAGIHHEIFSHLQLPYPTWEIHSRMSQSARGKATEAFRNSKDGVLFSSDVTARGIDVKGVTAVVQVGLPSNEEQCQFRAMRCRSIR